MANNADKLKNMSMDDLTKLVKKKKKQNNIEKVARNNNIFPQSYSQSSQWFMQQLATDCIYNVPQSYRIKGNIDIPRLERVLNQIVMRHEIMRTVFTAIDSVPSQIIKPFTPFKLNVIDISGVSGEEQENMLYQENEKQVRIPFNLTIGPLWNFVLLKLSEDEVVLTYTLHHIISDGWSFGVIINELVELYTRDLNGAEPLEPLNIQYVDYSEWQRKQMDSDKIQRQLEYWTNQLNGIKPYINLPLDAPRYANQTHKGDNCYLTISKEELDAVNSLCVKESITSYDFLLSIFFILMYKYSGDHDICIGTPVANRSRVELEKLIGLFINTVVIRANIEENNEFIDFVHNMKNTCVNAFENSEVPFEKVVEKLNVSRQSSYSPVFQVLYVQMETSQLGKQAKYSGLEVSTIPVSIGSSQFDLSMYVTIDNDNANLSLEYNTDLFCDETANQIMSDFQELLHYILTEPDKKIDYYLDKIDQERCCMAVCSTFVDETLNESMSLLIKKLVLPCDLIFAPYSQVFQQLMFKDSIMRRNTEGFNIILLRLEDWIQGVSDDFGEIKSLLCKNTEEFIQAVIDGEFCDLSIYLCPHSQKVADNGELALLINTLERRIIKECTGVSVYSAAKIANAYCLSDYHDEVGDNEWHIPYSREFFATLGTEIISNVFRKSIYDERSIYLIDVASMLNSDQNNKGCLNSDIWGKFENEGNIVVVRGKTSDIPRAFTHIVDRCIETDSVDAAVKICENMYNVKRDEIIVFSDNKAISEEQYVSFIVSDAGKKSLNNAFLL